MTAPALSLVPPPPPSMGDEEIERAVLACCLQDQHFGSVLEAVIAAGVTPEWFSARPRQVLMEAISELHGRGERIDLLSLRSQLSGGSDALAYAEICAVDLHDAEQVDLYLERLRDLVVRRRVYELASRLMVTCAKAECAELLADLRTGADRVERGLHAGSGVVTIGQALEPVVAAMDREADEILGVPTGFTDIDALLLGLEPGRFYVVAARPGVGKTVLAMNVAGHVARGGNGALYATLEMKDKELAERALSSEMPVDYRSLRTARLMADEKTDARETAEQMAQWPLFLFDRPAISLADLHSQCRYVARRSRLVLVVVDYLQLMRSPGITQREQQVAAIARGLKELAKTEGVAVLALSQLSRENEKRNGDHRPTLSDLRESGEIEQSADVVAFLFREELYKPNDASLAGKAEFIVRKNRSGEERTVDLQWQGRYQRYMSVARQQQQDQFRQFGGGR